MEISKKLYRRDIPIFIAAFSAALVIVESLTKIEQITPIKVVLVEWFTMIMPWTIILGYVTFITFHVKRISTLKERRDRNFYISLITILTAAFLFAIAFTTPMLQKGGLFKLIFEYTGGYLSGFYHVSVWLAFAWGIYRFMRPKSLEWIAFIVTFLLYSFKEIPVFPALIPQLTPIGLWVEAVVSKGGVRWALVSTAITAVAIGLRIILMKERGIIEEEVY